MRSTQLKNRSGASKIKLIRVFFPNNNITYLYKGPIDLIYSLVNTTVIPLDLVHRCEVHHSCKMASCGKTCQLSIHDLKFKVYTFCFGICPLDYKKQTVNKFKAFDERKFCI